MGEEPLVVGRVVKPHGVHGELVVDIRTDSPAERFAVGSVLGVRRQGSAQQSDVTVAAARPHTGRLLLRAEGVDGRDAAEALRGAFLTIAPDQLESIDDPDEFHDHELEGLAVVEQQSGAQVGVVRGIEHTAAGELLVVADASGREVLVPFVSAIVSEVDVERGQLVIDPPEGLLESE